jgi:hypothetical protein
VCEKLWLKSVSQSVSREERTGKGRMRGLLLDSGRKISWGGAGRAEVRPSAPSGLRDGWGPPVLGLDCKGGWMGSVLDY